MNTAQSPFEIKSQKDSKSQSIDFEQGNGLNPLQVVIDQKQRQKDNSLEKAGTKKVSHNLQTSFESIISGSA
jgi:hypothetical protein